MDERDKVGVDLSPNAIEPLIAALERGPEYFYRLVGTDHLAGKTMRALAARLTEVEAERDALETAREMLGGFWAKDNARAEAAEAALARLRADQDAMVEAATLLRSHAAAAALILRHFGVGEPVAKHLEDAVAEYEGKISHAAANGLLALTTPAQPQKGEADE